MPLALAAALVTLADIHGALRPFLSQWGYGAEGFATWIRRIEDDTARRLRDGEFEHLICFVLQSASFTGEPRIEPARSAREFVEGKPVPEAVRRRIAAFRRSEPREEPRLAYFAGLLARNPGVDLEAEYARVMRFLYEKEFASQSRQGGARRGFVASLYETRGYSSDTTPDSSTAVLEGLTVLRQRDPEFAPRRVLLVGPGMDFAPRTGLSDGVAPQSYQPAALRSALGSGVEIVCADINPRVVDYINGQKSAGVRAVLWNVLTRRPEPAAFDLVVATNVFLYFNARQLLLAVNNLGASLRPGGYLLHNDLREEMGSYGAAAGLPVTDGRMVRLAPGREVFDSFVLHRKRVD